MNDNIKKLVSKVINGINPNWTKNEKMRYVYVEVGKSLAKDATFFYSLGRKLGEESLGFYDLKERYIDDKIIDNKVVCKSAAIILKEIYDAIGIDCKLVKSADYQTIKSNEDDFDLHHWFLCCTGDDGKNYFLTLVPDLMNIQNNWQTEHFGTTISYYRRNIADETETPSYLGERIYETKMNPKEIEQLDMRIGYLKRKTNNGQLEEAPVTGNLDINDYIYYENGVKEGGLTQSQSPFIYENAMAYYGSNKGYLNVLAEETDFHKNIFNFINQEGKEINFLDTPLSKISINDINHWALLTQEKIIDYDGITDENKNVMVHQIDGIKSKILNVKELIDAIISKKQELKNDFNNESLKEEIKKLEQRAHKTMQQCRNVIYEVSRNFVNIEYRNSKDNSTSEYLIKRFETLFPTVLVLNEGLDSPMTSRCNGLGEQLALIDRVLRDLFDGNIISKEKNKSRIVRTALYDFKTEKYDLLFQIDKEYFYYMNPSTGEFKALSDPISLVTENGYTILDNEINERIAEIEKDIEGKKK